MELALLRNMKFSVYGFKADNSPSMFNCCIVGLY